MELYPPILTIYNHNDMKIEWASSFRSDGSRRKPPPSTMHGWLAKMRGTLVGNETLRNKGMREMRDARAIRKQKRERQRQARGTGSVFGFFSNRNKPPSSSRRGDRRPNVLVARPSQGRKPGTRVPQRPGMTPRASHNSRTSHNSRNSRGSQSRPRYNTRRSSGR